MLNSHKFDEIARKLADLVPDKVKGFSDDLQKNFRGVLQASLAKMDLVSREEFDAQTKVLAKTRAQLDIFEQRITELEKQLLPSLTVEVIAPEIAAETEASEVTKFS
jgi:BMFP domain-containing protein YqiC